MVSGFFGAETGRHLVGDPNNRKWQNGRILIQHEISLKKKKSYQSLQGQLKHTFSITAINAITLLSLFSRNAEDAGENPQVVQTN